MATRAAAQDLPADAPRERRLAERARLAMQRLAPRDRGIQRLLATPAWRPAWAVVAGVLTRCQEAEVVTAVIGSCQPQEPRRCKAPKGSC